MLSIHDEYEATIKEEWATKGIRIKIQCHDFAELEIITKYVKNGLKKIEEMNK